MSLDTDVLILGGGCAGLSLAAALAQRAPHLHVHVLEPRPSYARDRTWCFWNTEPHPFTAGVTHSWAEWRVRHAGLDVRRRSRRYAYQHLPADRFYQLATEILHNAGHVLSLGVSAIALRPGDNYVEADTDAGLLRARWVFDSRPKVPGTSMPVLVQRFLGWHVRTAEPCFDPSAVELMDFQPRGEAGRTTFFYILPFSTTEALVEATFLDDPSLAKPDADFVLRQRLERMQTGGYQVLYTESGALPMGERRPYMAKRSDRHIVDIGTRGGRVKPSSGYAFLRIQRQSAALAQALAAGASLPSTFESPLYGVLDAIFLRALQRDPERAPVYFTALFRRIPSDVLVRFLSETARPGEVLRVMQALPILDFLQAALLSAARQPA